MRPVFPDYVQARFDLFSPNPCVRHKARQFMLREHLRIRQWAKNVRAVLDSMEPVR